MPLNKDTFYHIVLRMDIVNCYCINFGTYLSQEVSEINFWVPSLTRFLHSRNSIYSINPLNAELNPICYLLALLGAHHFPHVSRIRVKLLTFRLLMSYIYIYIYIEHPFLMFLDYTQRRSTVGRTPLDE